MSEHNKGLLLTLAGILVLSPDALLIRLAGVDEMTVLFWRGLLVAVTLWGASMVMSGKLRLPRRAELISGVCYGGSTALFVIAIGNTLVSNTLVIISATPLIAAVLGIFVLGERVAMRTWLAVIGVALGLAVIFGGGTGSETLLGDLAALGAAAFQAGFLVTLRRAPKVDTSLSMAIGGALGALIAAPFAVAPLSMPIDAWPWLGLMGVVVLPVSFSLIAIGPRYITAAEVSLLMLLEVILGPLWVWSLMGEVPGDTTWMAGALVVGTLIAHTAAGMRRRAAPVVT